MKKQLLFSAIICCSQLIFGTTTTVTSTSGNTFSPNSVTINVGDTVNFQLTSIHNAVEVSQATWNANGTTALPGFSVPFGGGIVTGLAVGVHYYVCANHASMGMKGMITVTPASGIDQNKLNIDMVNIFPNPTNGKLTVVNQNIITPNTSLHVYNALGEEVYSVHSTQLQASTKIDLSPFHTGIYFVQIQNGENVYTKRIVLE
jgi:plastocyanin